MLNPEFAAMKREIEKSVVVIQKSFKYNTRNDTFEVAYLGMRKDFRSGEELPNFEIRYNSKLFLAKRRWYLDTLLCWYCQSRQSYSDFRVGRKVYRGKISMLGVPLMGEEQTNINPDGYEHPEYVLDKAFRFIDRQIDKAITWLS